MEQQFKENKAGKAIDVLELRVKPLEDRISKEIISAEAVEQETISKKVLEEAVQKVVSKHLITDKDLTNRKKNIMIYRVPEGAEESQECSRAKDHEIFKSMTHLRFHWKRKILRKCIG